MTILNKEYIKKYALEYLKRYDTSKKNLINVLKRRIYKFNVREEKNKKNLFRIINEVVDDLEMNKVINDDNYADSKIHSYLTMGKSIRLIRYNLLKKGLSSENINNVITKLKESAPDLEIQSAHTFARKKKLGKYGNFKNKEKDFAKMARAGFNYDIVLKVLEYD
tara:strand:+ start:267 stop:761 length:495 start_codon:yes stop_codon:yes gene_type:complete